MADINIATETYVDENAGGGETSAYSSAHECFFEGTDITISVAAGGGTVVVANMPDNQDEVLYTTITVPDGADGMAISGITAYYENSATSSTNLYCQFRTTHYDNSNGGTRTLQEGSSFTSASPTTADQTGLINAPADSYNSQPDPLSAGDVIGIFFRRRGNEANDTYGATLKVLGIRITFA